MNSTERELKELQQKICNIVNYILWLYEKRLISERTKNEILKICNSSEIKEDVQHKRRF